MDEQARRDELIRNLVGLLDEDERAVLRSLCRHAARGSGIVAKDAHARALANRLPSLLALGGDLRLRDPADLAALSAALEAPSGEDPVATDRCAAIRELLMTGRESEALREFSREGGIYFIHYHGVEATLDILSRFAPPAFRKHEVLTLALAMHALKSGNVNRARQLMIDRFGEAMRTLEAAVDAKATLSTEARAFRFVIAIYEDIPVSNRLRERLFDMLAEYPVEDHLHRGSFYNAMLAVCIQRREFDAAADIAARARHHYVDARCYLLVFYIDLHRVVLALRRGRLAVAEEALAAASRALALVTFDVPADRRLLGLVAATIAYEKGEPQELVRFIAEELDDFAYGELWPTVVELALIYCSRVLASEVGIGAALGFLDKWRVQQWRSRRFNLAITMREVDALQSANRWQGAADRLMAIQARINLTWIESAEDALSRLTDPTEIDLAMAWLRHLIQHVPRRAMLPDQLAALMRNENIGERDRGRLMLWTAHLARLRRDVGQARTVFAALLEETARLGVLTHLLGDRALLKGLLEDRRVAGHALSSPGTRAVVRRIEADFQARSLHDIPLTRQELRVLRLVAEGATNKYVARQLRLSEATVKFHLTHVFRKMGCRRRSEAISAARALGWLN